MQIRKRHICEVWGKAWWAGIRDGFQVPLSPLGKRNTFFLHRNTWTTIFSSWVWAVAAPSGCLRVVFNPLSAQLLDKNNNFYLLQNEVPRQFAHLPPSNQNVNLSTSLKKHSRSPTKLWKWNLFHRVFCFQSTQLERFCCYFPSCLFLCNLHFLITPQPLIFLTEFFSWVEIYCRRKLKVGLCFNILHLTLSQFVP